MNVGFIGAGHITRAVAQGLARADAGDGLTLSFHDLVPAAAGFAARETGGAVAPTLAGLVEAADVVVVAVRPHHVAGVLADVAELLGPRPLVSVAAGVSMERLRAALPGDAKVGRVMPNLAAALGLGVFLLVPGSLGEDEAVVDAVFARAGVVVPMRESEFDAATVVAGCMPGILAMVVRDFAAAAERRGLAPDVAVRLAISGVHGAAAMIAKQGDPAAIIAAGATPGGMTAAAIATLEEHEIAAAIDHAVETASRRAGELA